MRLKTTRRDYGCPAGSTPSPPLSAAGRALPPPTFASAPPHPTYPGPCPRLRLRPRPRPLDASISVHSLREGCRSSVARGRLGVASCVPCFRQPRRKRGRPRSRLAASCSVFCLQAAAFAVLNKLMISSMSSSACSFKGKDPTLTDIAVFFLGNSPRCAAALMTSPVSRLTLLRYLGNRWVTATICG